MSDETLLIVSLALCFGMVVLAARVGFSPAFGAFIMGPFWRKRWNRNTLTSSWLR